jgi:hypothetical protein
MKLGRSELIQNGPRRHLVYLAISGAKGFESIHFTDSFDRQLWSSYAAYTPGIHRGLSLFKGDCATIEREIIYRFSVGL